MRPSSKRTSATQGDRFRSEGLCTSTACRRSCPKSSNCAFCRKDILEDEDDDDDGLFMPLCLMLS